MSTKSTDVQSTSSTDHLLPKKRVSLSSEEKKKKYMLAVEYRNQKRDERAAQLILMANNAGKRVTFLDVYGLTRDEALEHIRSHIKLALQLEWYSIKIVFGRGRDSSVDTNRYGADIIDYLRRKTYRYEYELDKYGSVVVFLPTTQMHKEIDERDTLQHEYDEDMKYLCDVDAMMADDDDLWYKLTIASIWGLSILIVHYLLSRYLH